MLYGDALQNRNGSPVRRARGNALTGRESFRMERATERALHSWKPTEGVLSDTTEDTVKLLYQTVNRLKVLGSIMNIQKSILRGC
ncbi:hypothetical protein NDU88_001404 [Pleurodeles waltl]|uniref:Uncharacterized protein n=1 Tax=Pleurodeles waltl TaxID=8319 RepID=A0AAV7S8V7_PLEWA|nr:hypothetical protein NDU88_001404 [Pleurodeles waltl]